VRGTVEVERKRGETKAARIKAKEEEERAAKILEVAQLKEEEEEGMEAAKEEEEEFAVPSGRVNRGAARDRTRLFWQLDQHPNSALFDDKMGSGGDCDGNKNASTTEALQRSLPMADDDANDLYAAVTATGLTANTSAATKRANSHKMLPSRRAAARQEETIDDIRENAQVEMNLQARSRAKRKEGVNAASREKMMSRQNNLLDCGVFHGATGDSSSSGGGGGDRNNGSIMDTIKELRRSSSLAPASEFSFAFIAARDDTIVPATNEDDDAVHNTVKRLSSDINEASDTTKTARLSMLILTT